MEKRDTDMQKIYEYQRDPHYAQDKLTELEDRSNIRIDRIRETKGET